MKKFLFAFSSVLIWLFALCVFSCATTAERTTSHTKSRSAEYLRSVAALGTVISEETFQEDKIAIMNAITALEKIMERKDAAQWRKYLSPSSVAYLRDANNMRAVSAKLPPQLKIRTDEDYFKYVFIPARQDNEIDEIRYVSPKITKAVRVGENNDIVYYYFEKVNNVWLIKLDEGQD